MTMSAQHGTFTLERTYDAPLAMVFQAWADKDAKARWFSAPSEWTDVVRIHDFRVGGSDRLKGKWAEGRTTEFRAEYRDIVENARIVYVYDLYVNDTKISVSLATIEFAKAGKGTKLTVTEQGAFLDGYEDGGARERGTADLLDRLGRSLEA
jgi:uncharacterized protein YndB with AHSA1/START domain